MANFIVIGVLLVAVGLAVTYIIKEKKSGKKCIGRPSGGACCNKKDGHSCSCHKMEK